MKEHEPSGEPTEPDLVEIRAVLGRANAGDEGALPRLRELLDATGLWRRLGDLSTHAEMTWLDHVGGANLAMKEMLARKLQELKAELGGPAPSPLEKLLVERIATTWLMVHHADVQAAEVKDGEPRRSDQAMKRQTNALRRYTTAITALATVRRLLPPATAPAGTGGATRATRAARPEHRAGPKVRRRSKPVVPEEAPGGDGEVDGGTAQVALFEPGREARGQDG